MLVSALHSPHGPPLLLGLGFRVLKVLSFDAAGTSERYCFLVGFLCILCLRPCILVRHLVVGGI